MPFPADWDYYRDVLIPSSPDGELVGHQFSLSVNSAAGISSGSVVYLDGKANSDFSDSVLSRTHGRYT